MSINHDLQNRPQTFKAAPQLLPIIPVLPGSSPSFVCIRLEPLQPVHDPRDIILPCIQSVSGFGKELERNAVEFNDLAEVEVFVDKVGSLFVQSCVESNPLFPT